MIAAIGADAIRRGVRMRALPRAHIALPIVGVSLFLVAAASFVVCVPFLERPISSKAGGVLWTLS